MAGQCELGVTGLATMGANLARNAARKGFPVAVHNRTGSRTRELLERHGDEGELVGSFSTEEFVAALARPRRILVMVKAGPAVDAVLEELAGHLDEGDLLIDGGNSYFEDTVRREQAMASRGLRFLGTGVSGGEEGALKGPSIMAGGTAEAYGLVEQLLTTIAAQVDGTPCCRLVGPGGAGHYVKMVHNGIEYADMQLIAEAYDLLGQGAGMAAAELAEVFARWNQGELDSFLIETTAKVLRQVDEATGRPLVDVILDEAEQKGTGRWTVQSALELGVPVTGITEAVFARVLSSQKRAADGRGQGPGGAVGPAGGGPGRGVRRRRPRRPVRLQGGRLRPGVRADRGRRRRLRLGRRAGRPGHHLAGRLHHPGPVPGPHPRGLRGRPGPAESALRRVLPRRRRATPRTPGAGSWPPRSSWAWPPRPSPRRWPTTTASGANAARPTCSRPSATSSAPTPTGGPTGRAASTPAGPRTARRSRPDPAPFPGDLAGAGLLGRRLRPGRIGERAAGEQRPAGERGERAPSGASGTPTSGARPPGGGR